MKHLLVPMLAATALTAASGAAKAESQWRHAGAIGMRQFAVVDPAAAGDATLLKQAAKEICPPGQACMVMFWSEAESVPSKMPMTRNQQQAVVAQYLRNPTTGSEELLLKCQAADSGSVKCLR